MKKKLLSVITCLALCLLTACAPKHTHAPAEGWELNANEHWQVCECGETLNAAAHTLDEDNRCTVCGAGIWDLGDSTEVYVFTDSGDPLRIITYDVDGTIISEMRYEYEYDAAGNKVREMNYMDDVLFGEWEYGKNSAGDICILKETHYFEDGSKDTTEYDEAGNVTSSAYYDADGSVGLAYAYEYSEDASWIGEKEYSGEKLAAERAYMVDEDGMQKLLTEVLYNEDGSRSATEYDLYDNVIIEISYDKDGNVEMDRRHEYTYDENGNRTMAKTYDNGVLVEEVEYFSGSDDEGSWEMSGKTTTYHADGSKTVSDRDLELTWSSEITYDAAGNVVNELRYEYAYDEDGDQLTGKTYENGVLTEESQAIVDESGETTGLLITAYGEDGTKTVYEYNASFEEVGKTVYDADGNAVE